jgi:uncharacterized membrane protein YkgB
MRTQRRRTFRRWARSCEDSVSGPNSGFAEEVGIDVDITPTLSTLWRMSRGESRALEPFLFLRVSLGLIYFLFGFLKFFPDLSPAELLAGETVARVTGHWLTARQALLVLGVSECAIGLGILLGIRPRVVFGLFLAHMAGTFLPLFVLPELMFKVAPFAPTLDGQYVLKNVVLVAAGWAVLSSLGRSTAVASPSQGDAVGINP